jgi:hypothetical protein
MDMQHGHAAFASSMFHAARTCMNMLHRHAPWVCCMDIICGKDLQIYISNPFQILYKQHGEEART